jgi:hypothetical protein
MALIPLDSPLRAVPDTLDRRSVLYLDGIRYAIHIFDLSGGRLANTLHALSIDGVPRETLTEQIAAAMSDAWTMVDAIHRLRELLSQVPGLKKKQPELQLFLQRTSTVEGLRHFYQHFRTEIDTFVGVGMPLWGSLSWIHTDLTSGENSIFTIVPGTYFEGATVCTCRVDHVANKYMERLALHAGATFIDLTVLAELVDDFIKWYVTWYREKFPDQSHYAADLHLRLRVRLRGRESQDASPPTNAGS